MSGPRIPYGRQSLDESDIEAVVDVLRGDWLTQGPAVRDFEDALARVVGAPHAVAFSSGTAALHAACFAAGIEPGDELLTSAITFAASANCGAYLGATPRFADIDPATRNVSAETMTAAAGPMTRVAVPVHFAGLASPVAAIRAALGEEVRIIEDASHALGAREGSEPVGSCRHSDMAVFSFHPVKAIATGEGGMVTTRDPDLCEHLLAFRNHGFAPGRSADEPWAAEQTLLGFNYRLSDIHSALGRSQLAKLEQFIERRNRIADRYRELLGGADALEMPPPAAPGSRHAWHLFVIRHRDGAPARRRLYEGLRERGILAQVHYRPVYRHRHYRTTYGYIEGLCPEAERYYEGCLSLPCFPALTGEQQDRVIEAVLELA